MKKTTVLLLKLSALALALLLTVTPLSACQDAPPESKPKPPTHVASSEWELSQNNTCFYMLYRTPPSTKAVLFNGMYYIGNYILTYEDPLYDRQEYHYSYRENGKTLYSFAVDGKTGELTHFSFSDYQVGKNVSLSDEDALISTAWEMVDHTRVFILNREEFVATVKRSQSMGEGARVTLMRMKGGLNTCEFIYVVFDLDGQIQHARFSCINKFAAVTAPSEEELKLISALAQDYLADFIKRTQPGVNYVYTCKPVSVCNLQANRIALSFNFEVRKYLEDNRLSSITVYPIYVWAE